MRFKSRICFFMALFLSFPLIAAEYTNGSIRLVLNADNGRFSLYSLDNSSQRKPLALFADQDQRTSFLSVMINDRSYKMGDSSAFKIRLGGGELNPALVFESSFMTVTQEFSFIGSANQAAANGIRITITLENRGDRQISSGARFLLDTQLGEKRPGFPFTTNYRTINSETLVTRTDSDRYWIDRNERAGLAGSINTGGPGDPDSVLFANWKKLSDVSWKAVYQPGSNFNLPPYSVGDTAVCYYFEPRTLGRGEKRSYEFVLLVSADGVDLASAFSAAFAAAFADSTALAAPGSALIRDLPDPFAADSSNARAEDLAAIKELISRIEARIASGTATEDELAAFEHELNKFRAKYGPGGK